MIEEMERNSWLCLDWVFISLVDHNLAETNSSLQLEKVPKTKLSNCW